MPAGHALKPAATAIANEFREIFLAGINRSIDTGRLIRWISSERMKRQDR
jgi:hypothetical protein